MAQKQSLVPIHGTRQLERLNKNLGEAAVELTPEDLRQIEEADAKITVQGARRPVQLQHLTEG